MECTIQINTVISRNLIAVGCILNSYGIKGWIKVKPYSKNGTALLSVVNWWLDKPELHSLKTVQVKYHNGNVLAKLIGIDTCNAATALKGAIVFISRKYFPLIADNEFYWVDLIGLAVENLQAQYLGTIKNLIDNNAHTILCVLLPKKHIINKNKIITEILIPFVDPFIKSVAIIKKTVTVDWQLDY